MGSRRGRTALSGSRSRAGTGSDASRQPEGSRTTPFLSANSLPQGIVAGPDGALWFTETAKDRIGRITTAGTVTEFPTPTSGFQPGRHRRGLRRQPLVHRVGRRRGSDASRPRARSRSFRCLSSRAASTSPRARTAALWFTGFDDDRIARITTAGVVTEFLIPSANCGPLGIAAGPDGALWFTEFQASKIGRLAIGEGLASQIGPEYPLPTSGLPYKITAGSGRRPLVHRDGPHRTHHDERRPSRHLRSGWSSTRTASSSGPDGALWFTESGSNQVGRLTTAGGLTHFTVAGGPRGLPWVRTEPSGSRSRPEIGSDGSRQPGTFTGDFPIPSANSSPADDRGRSRRRPLVHGIRQGQNRAHHDGRRRDRVPDADRHVWSLRHRRRPRRQSVVHRVEREQDRAHHDRRGSSSSFPCRRGRASSTSRPAPTAPSGSPSTTATGSDASPPRAASSSS